MRKNRSLVWILGSLLAGWTWAQSEAPLPKVRVPKELQDKKIWMKNRATGKGKIVEVGDDEFIASEDVRALMDPAKPAFEPEFAVLGKEERKRPYRARSSQKPGLSPLTQSLVFDQPVWRRLNFKSSQGKSGELVFHLSSQGGEILSRSRKGVTTVTSLPVPSSKEASQRRRLVEKGDIRKLFDIGWKSLSVKRNDLALKAFGRLLKRQDSLTQEQWRQAHLGHGLATFHQEGCANVERDFVVAVQDSKNVDEVSYFRGLCAMEAKRFPEAGALFQTLSQKTDSKYAESSRFFVGVVAENEERYEDAESAYLDTIDFAHDQALVGLAKTRLENVRQLKEQRDLARKWLTVALTAAAGWDSNVVGLPRSLAPADFSLKSKSSPTLLGLAYTEVRPPWTRAVDLKLKYTLLELAYLSSEIRPNYNIRSHELGTSVGFTPSDHDQIGFGLSYNSVFKATSGKMGEFMATPSFQLDWQKSLGLVEEPSADMSTTFKVSLARTRNKGVPADFNATANSYLLSYRYNFRQKTGHVFGPGLDAEYKPASGREVSYYSATLLGKWDSPFGPESWELYASQEMALQYTPYYQSSQSRKDKILRYTGSVAKLVAPWMEVRLQFVGSMNLSSVASYTYNKAQFNLMLSAFF